MYIHGEVDFFSARLGNKPGLLDNYLLFLTGCIVAPSLRMGISTSLSYLRGRSSFHLLSDLIATYI